MSTTNSSNPTPTSETTTTVSPMDIQNENIIQGSSTEQNDVSGDPKNLSQPTPVINDQDEMEIELTNKVNEQQ